MIAFKVILYSLVLTGWVSSQMFESFCTSLQDLIVNYNSELSFTLSRYLLRDLPETSYEFQDYILRYAQQYGPVDALHKAIEYIYHTYQDHVNNTKIREIERTDPVGFIAYLHQKKIEKGDTRFKKSITTFYETMKDRVRLLKMFTDLTSVPDVVRFPLATEYMGLDARPINHFTELVSKTKQKMYPIDNWALDDFDKHESKRESDVQLLSATYFGSFQNILSGAPPLLHAMCVYYNARDKKLHIYDSSNPEYLEQRQEAIVDKLYPYRQGIVYESSIPLQRGNTTCAVFAITYATMLLMGKNPAKDRIKLNEVYGDETLYMRLHILDMFANKKVFWTE